MLQDIYWHAPWWPQGDVSPPATQFSLGQLLDSDHTNSFGVLLIVLLGPINDRPRSPVAEGSLLGGLVGSAASGSWVCRGELCAHTSM